MHNIVIFCEDFGHESVIKSLILKIAPSGFVKVKALSARYGKPRTFNELEKYLKEVEKGLVGSPEAIVVAIDANCHGYADTRKEIENRIPDRIKHLIPFVYAIPDPHVERWLLVDSHAFKEVFGKGCQMPNQKCEKDRYKKLLREEIKQAGGKPLIGGMEHAEEIIKHMDIKRVKTLDDSMKKFIEDMENVFKGWDK